MPGPIPLVPLLLLFVAGLVSADISPRELGDRAFLERHRPERARAALAAYREYRRQAPEASDSAWRVAMAAQFVGFRLTENHDEKLDLFGEGRDAATDGAKRDPDCAPCHFWAGINRALYGETSGIFRTITTLPIVRKNLEEARRLDCAYAFGGPDRILGLIDQKVPGILGGTNEGAREHFESAIAAAPENPMNYVFLAKLHREERGDEAAYHATVARGMRAVKLPPQYEVESREAWHELEKMAQSPVTHAKSP